MQKTIDYIKILVILSFILCSCSRDIYSGKTYTVEKVNGRIVEFKGVSNYYVVDNDTVKVGDKLKLQRTFNRKKVTIY